MTESQVTRREVRDMTTAEAFTYGVERFNMGDLKGAENMFRAVLEHIPDCWEAMNMLAVVLADNRDYYQALYYYDMALRHRKRDPMIIQNRAMVLFQIDPKRHARDVETEFRKALHIEPQNPAILANFCVILEAVGRYEEAIEVADKALVLEPNVHETWGNKGISLIRLGRHQEAIRCYERAIELNPNFAEAHYNLGIANLMLGNLERGFAEWEWRLHSDSDVRPFYINSPSPLWRGEDLTGKTILVHAEMGIGDNIQFLRYVPMVAARAARVLLVLHTPLWELVEKTYEHDDRIQVVRAGADLPPHDFYIPIMSLPNRFGTTLKTIPAPWSPSETLISCRKCEHWRNIMTGARIESRRAPKGNDALRLRAIESVVGEEVGFRVGLCWSGNWKHKNDAHRSIPLKQFARVTSGVPDAKFYGLQQEIRQVDAAAFSALTGQPLPLGENMQAAMPKMPMLTGPMVDLSPHLKSMDDTAHAMGWLDLVITCDTSVAHIAATMDVETWVLLPARNTDWRWLMDRKDSPWYPSIRLFRQEKAGDWDTTLNQVRDALRARVVSQVAA